MTTHTFRLRNSVAIALPLMAFLFCLSPAVVPQATPKIGAVHVKGLAHFKEARRKLKSGDVFDASYSNEFTQREVGAFLPRSGSKPPKIALVATPDTAQHTVNVTLRLLNPS